MHQLTARETARYSFAIAACVVISMFCLAYPMYVIRPFRHQGVRELGAALAILRGRWLVFFACIAIALRAIAVYWRRQPVRWRRIAAGLGVAAICLCAALSRVNVYEKMFHPIAQPSFQAAAKTKLDGAEQIIAVNLGGVARAYPVRGVSYHHVVNDVVGGVPIVATY